MANFFDQFDASAGGGGQPEPQGLFTVRPKGAESPYADAISKIESGGNYRAVGPATRTGDRAVGRYQVMSSNIPSWTKEVLGREMKPSEFHRDDAAQDAVFNAKFGSYVDKYGPEGAAKAWFAGEKGMQNLNARDVNGTTVADYAAKFSQNAPLTDVSAQSRQALAAPSAPASGGPNFFDQFDAQANVPSPVDRRFPEQQPANPKMQAGLEAAGRQATTGPAQSAGAHIATDFMNQGSAAAQGTTPNTGAHAKSLISDQVFENEAGEVTYRDATGKMVPTDQNKHVALRDPVDGRVKVYARTDDTNEGRISAAGRILGTGMAAGAVTARPGIATASKEIVPTASDIFSSAKPYYRAFKNEAGKIEIPKETARGLVDRLKGALEKANFIDEIAPSVYAAINILGKKKGLTVDVLQNIKRVIGKSFNSPDKNVRDAAGVASKEIGQILSEVAPEAAASLRQGDAIHSTAMAMQELQRRGAVADLRKGRAGYGGNAVNSMRQVLSPIVERAVKGMNTPFKPNEIAAMREIVEGNGKTNALRLVGQASPSKGIMPTSAAGGAMYAAGPVALVIPAIGAASNKLATILTGNQIDRLKSLVAKRSPAYAHAVSKAVQRYENAQMELVNNPSPAKFAAYLTGSRLLAAGFQRDGIQVTSGDLLRAIQGPAASRAEEEQQ